MTKTQPTTPTQTHGADHDLKKISRKEREKREVRAARDAAWFYGVLKGSVDRASPETRVRAVAIAIAMKAIPAFHRGALSLRYTPKHWPPAIVGTYGELTSLVVRLACAMKPSVGSTEALEAAAVQRLLLLETEDEYSVDPPLEDLELRARKHVRRACRALAKATPKAVREATARSSGVVLVGGAQESA